MKAAILASPFALFIACALVSCENPADKTTDAEVGEAVEKEEAEVPEGAVKYVFTDQSTIGFTGSKVTGSHNGGFKDFTGHFTLVDGQPVGNDHKVVIDMTSTWSDDDKLTGHLKSPDFFDVAKFPTSTFDVTSISRTDDSGTVTGEYSVTGNLDFHGVTKSITFPASVAMDGDTAVILAKFDINRFDFGVEYPGKKDDLIRPEVVLEFALEAKPE